MKDDLKIRLKRWQIEEPSADLANRIATHALQHKQIIPFSIRLSRALEAALTDWTYGLAYKMASIALIACIGVTIGLASPQPESLSIDIVPLALGTEDVEGMEES